MMAIGSTGTGILIDSKCYQYTIEMLCSRFFNKSFGVFPACMSSSPLSECPLFVILDTYSPLG